MKPPLIAVAALLCAAAGTSCSSSDGPRASTSTATASTPTSSTSISATASTSPSEDQAAAVEKAYRTYVQAFLTGDGATAYQLLSDRCREKEPLSQFAAISESAAEIYGKVDYTINSVHVDGDTATVDATYPVEALNQGGGSGWVLEDGQWHTDKCD